MPNINIQVAAKIATNMSPGVAIVCGNSDYTLTFTFDAEWAAHPLKTARFVYTRDGQVHYVEAAFSSNVVAVPVLSGITDVYVGVYAGDLRTTTPARILCDRSILCGGGTHEEPPEDIYNQILAACNALVANAATKDYVAATAAPAGYGLGENSSRSVDNPNTALQSGWYRVQTPYVGWMRVDAYATSHLTQTLYLDAHAGCSMQRHRGGSVWGEWEWVNPPMVPGVEYRTTERFNGHPVYTKFINYGKGPSSGAANLAGFGGDIVFIDATLKCVNDSGWGSMDSFVLIGEYGSGGGTISISNAGDLSNANLYLSLKYYKGAR